jgi:hypothetical protein
LLAESINGPFTAADAAHDDVADAKTPQHWDESPKYARTTPELTAVMNKVQIMTLISRIRPRISMPDILLRKDATPPAIFPMATKLTGRSEADVS